MTTTVTAKIIPRQGTAAAWISANPVLLFGERGMETDTGYVKVGDGVTAWNDLDYTATEGAFAAHINSTSNPHSVTAAQVGALTSGAADLAYAAIAHDHSGVYEPADATLLKQSDVDDTPVNGVTTAPVSSNWAYDHAALTTAHGISTFGASLVDDADAGTARTTLGLGTASTTAATDYATASHNHTGTYLAVGADAADLTSGTATEGQVLTADGAGGAAWEAASGGGGGITDGATLSTGLTFPISGLHILDTDGTHDLILSPGSNLTADRTLTLTTGDANRTLTLTADASIGGTNTGDQNLSSYVTGPASSTDNALARFNSTGGKTLKDSVATLSNNGALTLTGATVTASEPILDVTQTWNSSGVTFTGLKMNVTDTASAADSNLLDLLVGTVSQFKVQKTGDAVGKRLFFTSTSLSIATADAFCFGTSKTNGLYGVLSSTQLGVLVGTKFYLGNKNNAFEIKPEVFIGWSSTPGSGHGAGTLSGDLYLARDSANTLAQRLTTNAQTYRLYNTYTDASNYERLAFTWDSNTAKIQTESAGTGTLRDLSIGSTGGKLAFLGASPVVRQAHVADADTAHALNATFSDTEVEAALNALGTKINSILATLEAFGLHATS